MSDPPTPAGDAELLSKPLPGAPLTVFHRTFLRCEQELEMGERVTGG